MVTKEEIILDIKANISEIIAGVFVLSIAMLLLLLAVRDLTTILIGLIACISIIMLGVEKRASLFDKIVSMSVILVVAFGFILLT